MWKHNAVFTTWEVSFQALGRAAQELLTLCGFLDNEDIWYELLPQDLLKEELQKGMSQNFGKRHVDIMLTVNASRLVR
jgi:hypothetical protein